MSDLDELYELKKKVDRKKKEVHKAEGALSQALKMLKQKFGCSTKEEALKSLEVWRKRSASSKKKFQLEMEKFKKTYPDLFDEEEE